MDIISNAERKECKTILAIGLVCLSEEDDSNYFNVLTKSIRLSDTILKHDKGKYVIILNEASFAQAKDIINRIELELLLVGDMKNFDITYRIIVLPDSYTDSDYSESISKAIVSIGG